MFVLRLSRLASWNNGTESRYYDGEPVVRFGFHNLRHRLATWLAEQGKDPKIIQRMLRHSSQDMTMHYIHPKAREAQEQYIAEGADNGDTLRVQ